MTSLSGNFSILRIKQRLGWEVNRTWEHLLSLYAQVTDPYIRKSPDRLLELRDLYKGKRCFVMGNGPSLNKTDLDLLKYEYVWGTNKIYLLFDRINWRPSFYVAVDTRVVPDIAQDIRGLTLSLPQTLFFFPKRFREKNIIYSGQNVFWYHEVPTDEFNLPGGMFTEDASRRVYSVCTVTVAALQLAVHLGFNPIYLIGCDTSYKIPNTAIRDEKIHDGLVSTQNDDPNHFDPSYFGVGSKWHDPHVDRMIFHYQQARRYCDSIGVGVYNATLGGELEVFSRVDYFSLFPEN